MGWEKLVYSRPVEWQPARFREHHSQCCSAPLHDTPEARRATQHPPGKGLQTLLPACARALCSLRPWVPRSPSTGVAEESLGLWNVLSTRVTPSRAHFLFPEEGQSRLGSTRARPRAMGACGRARRGCKVSQPNPNSP